MAPELQKVQMEICGHLLEMLVVLLVGVA